MTSDVQGRTQRRRWLPICFASVLGLAPLGALAHPVAGQEFLPPEEGTRRGSFWLGLEGFSARFGAQVGDESEAVVAIGLDLGNLGSDRIRLRPSAEFGFGNRNNSYVINADITFRLTEESAPAIPYLGLGVGLIGAESCGDAPGCPTVSPQFSLGFEAHVSKAMNWLVEYRAEDGFGRHRILVGLATRRGL
jgi:hypothetical protein